MKNRKTISVIMFGMALGIYLSINFASFVIPAGFALSLISTPVLGLFWPYLTKKQNITIGIFRYIVSLPFQIKSTYQMIAYLDLRIGVLLGIVDIGIIQKANATMQEQLYQTLADTLLTVAPALSKAKLIIWASIFAFGPFFFIIPYFFYLYFKKKGIYKQIPYDITTEM